MDSSQILTVSPSFNYCSSMPNLAEIAARVAKEFPRPSSDSDFDSTESKSDEDPSRNESPRRESINGVEEDFEFSFNQPESLPISAEDIFVNGEIRPVFPLFNTDLLLESNQFHDSKPRDGDRPPVPRRQPLGRLLAADREAPSCSSSESEDLDKIPADTYCVWMPASSSGSISRRGVKKSSSARSSSQRWKFLDLMFRSNSDGSKDGSRGKGEEIAPPSNGNSMETVTLGNLIGSRKIQPPGGHNNFPATQRKGLGDEKRRRSVFPLLGFLAANVHPY